MLGVKKSAPAWRIELSTPTPIYHHVRQVAKDNISFIVKVENGNSGRLARSAARCHARVGIAHQLRVCVLGQEHVVAFPRAIVCLVRLWCDNPIPAKRFKVYLEGKPTASRLCGLLGAGQASHPSGAGLLNVLTLDF